MRHERITAMRLWDTVVRQLGKWAAVFFISPNQRIPEFEWLNSLFNQPQLSSVELARPLFALQPQGASADTSWGSCVPEIRRLLERH